MGCQCANQCAKNYLPNKKELDSQELEKEESNKNFDNNNEKLKSKKIINYRNINNNNNFTNNISNNSTNNLFQYSTNQFSSFNNLNDIVEHNFNIRKKENIIDFDTNILPEDDFSLYLFDEINKIRIDPKSYIHIIQSNKNKVVTDKKNRLIFKSKVKVALYQGIPIFDDAINSLQITQPMNKLIFNPHLCIELPKNEDEIKDRMYLKKKINEICENNNVIVKSYWRDIVKDPETSFILMIVDDCGTNNSGRKRADLLNPEMKFIGINSIMIGKYFACYIVLSDK
jgi:hypothetical protein